MVEFKLVTKIVFGLIFIAAGANHFRDPKFYEAIMPPYIPWHYTLVPISGIIEILLGIGLLVPKFSVYSAWGIILFLLAVFPVHIHMLYHPELYPNLPAIALWLRLPLQGFLIAWAYWYTR